MNGTLPNLNAPVAAATLLRWVRGYRLSWLGPEALAGLTLAAYAIPVSLAYASLAGMPPQAGLYCYLLGGIGYALFGSSRHLAFGPTSAISLVVGVSLARLAGGDPSQHAALASLTAILVAVLFGIAWLLRLSIVASFISESILTGFKAGAALAIASTQLPKLFGVPGGGDHFFERLWLVGTQLGQTQMIVLALGLWALGLLWAGERRWPGRPVALGVVIAALLVVSLGGLERWGVRVVGDIPSGLPRLGIVGAQLSAIDVSTLRDLVRIAFACFLLGFIESLAAARALAQEHQYEVDDRAELLGLGVANLACGLGQGYPAAGGLSQSAVNAAAGARTPLSLIVASGALGLVLVFATGLFRNLPDAVLAAVVLIAVMGLIDVREIRLLWRSSRLDFNAALIAFVGVLALGILDGVIVAVIASLVMILLRFAHPHIAFLGRIPRTDRFSDLARHPDNEPLPGVLAFRVESSLLYFNADMVHDTILERVNQTVPGLTLVVFDLSTSPYVDHTSAHMLCRLHDQLAARGLAFRVAEAHGEARDILRAVGLEERIGHLSRKISLAEVIQSENRSALSELSETT